MTDERMLAELEELIRIPSVSTGEPDRDALHEAASWLGDRIRRSGGTCDVVETDGNPLVVGELRAPRDDAPTVMVYGHYDVQSAGPLELWETPPFDPIVKGDRLYARGASDDKGNMWPLIQVACEMHEAGELPVHVRFLIEGEEEAGSAPVMRWIEADERGADACIVFDSGSLDPAQPAITVGTRGIIQALVTVTVAERDMHSGIFGGSVHNAIHVLARALVSVLPGPDGILREELRAGVEPIPEVERASWDALPSGDLVLAFSSGTPLTSESGSRYYAQNAGEPSLDVTMFRAGEPRTIVPAEATANVTMRLAPGQSNDAMQAEMERLVRAALPDGIGCSFRWEKGVDAAAFDAESPPLRIAREAFEAATGVAPVLFRLGGSIPILAPLARRGIQTIVSGFATPQDMIHAPNESYPLASLEAGARTARELYLRLADLPR